MILTAVANVDSSLIANIDWSKPSWDLFIVLFFIVASLLYGLSLGRDRIVVILVSIYMSLAVVNTAPFLTDMSTEIGVNNLFVVRVSLFVGVFIALFVLMSRSALLRTIAASDNHGAFWQIIVFSILHVGLLISIILSFLPPEATSSLAPLTKTVFNGDIGRFAWIVAPILLMSLVKAEPKRRRAALDE